MTANIPRHQSALNFYGTAIKYTKSVTPDTPTRNLESWAELLGNNWTNSLKPSSYGLYHWLCVEESYIIPTERTSVLYGFRNQQRLFPYKILTDLFL
jgi:hypothetical protein